MWTYHPELLARAVPRYTSYPTAAEFDERVGRLDQVAALQRVGGDTPVSLYVHIPYCRDICWYCGCNTGAANRSARLANYLEGLTQEIGLVAARLGGRGRVGRIAFGGGSPNALPPVSFVRLLDRLITSFDAAAAKISIELDPRSLDDDWYDVIAMARIDNASLGCQTFAPHVQKAIGRVQPLAMIDSAVGSLRSAGIKSLNFDLMYGLPGQSLGDLESTLTDTIRLRADRVALFGYAHLPAVISRQRRIDATDLPDARTRFYQAAAGFSMLTQAGYEAIGFDHFAMPLDSLALAARAGRVRRNFQGFTDDEAEVVIGLGASAISLFPDLIIQNEKLAGRYRMLVTAGNLAGQRGVVRSAETRRRAHLIEQLLCTGFIDVPDDMWEGARPALLPFVERHLVEREGSRLTISPEGRPYARGIASAFDSFRNVSTGTFSNAV